MALDPLSLNGGSGRGGQGVGRAAAHLLGLLDPMAGDAGMRVKLDMEAEYRSCHTARGGAL
jgi:hypothetical protein